MAYGFVHLVISENGRLRMSRVGLVKILASQSMAIRGGEPAQSKCRRNLMHNTPQSILLDQMLLLFKSKDGGLSPHTM